ncbi:capsular polysaccharide biosynthesis protein CapF [Virgibacillus pantothenticus]|uniref:capsular polysaccharide biosynthesis protein CapF n=1 Tax=Virgibacillus pantothenticus TaxID=1473 RepID=UPI0009850D42|nr:capsular polysaccharide biosynthesis protein CapF [Virgibacillus pantothenticus]
MNILVTGANGFIARNLIVELKNKGYTNIFEYTKETDIGLLNEYCQKAAFVFHLAGINRPKNATEFMKGNYGFTEQLLETLKKHSNHCPIMLSSSTQAKLSNPYGLSKKAGEDLLLNYAKETGAKVLIYRFPNVFGKWCKPNYNSAIATFCYNIARELPITVNDRNVTMNLLYIDDLVEDLISVLNNKETINGDYCEIPVSYTATLGEIVDLIYSFKESRDNLSIPDMSDPFTKKLYSTYLSYLPEAEFSYDLKMNMDHRGSFTEFIKTLDRGQVSVNISKPGITKGNHWHHTKNEKFLVVSGNGVIRFRKIDTNEVIEYYVSGKKLEVVDIPPGYTHNIENLGDTDMVTIMWANEFLDLNRPDTYYLEV